jgi:hypothetical protein
LIANLSGLAKNIALALNVTPKSLLAGQIRSVGFIAAAMLPLSIMIIWRNNAVSEIRRRIGKGLVIYALSSGLLIAGCLALGTGIPSFISSASTFHLLLNQDFVGNLTIYNGFLLILLGASFLLPGTLDNLTDRVAISLMIAGLFLSSMSAVLDGYVSLPTTLAHIIRIARFQSIVLLLIGSGIRCSRPGRVHSPNDRVSTRCHSPLRRHSDWVRHVALWAFGTMDRHPGGAKNIRKAQH